MGENGERARRGTHFSLFRRLFLTNFTINAFILYSRRFSLPEKTEKREPVVSGSRVPLTPKSILASFPPSLSSRLPSNSHLPPSSRIYPQNPPSRNGYVSLERGRFHQLVLSLFGSLRTHWSWIFNQQSST